jgi:hypothetical protein
MLSRAKNSSLTELKSPSASGPAPALPDHSIFISYRRNDSGDIAGRLYDRLRDILGENAVFWDVYSMRAAHDFRTQMEASLNRCHVFLCVMGDQWAGPSGANTRLIDDPADYVRIEVETALRRGVPVIPVFVRGAQMPPPAFFPETLKELAFRHGLPLRADPDFPRDLAHLISELTVHLPSQKKVLAEAKPK